MVMSITEIIVLEEHSQQSAIFLRLLQYSRHARETQQKMAEPSPANASDGGEWLLPTLHSNEEVRATIIRVGDLCQELGDRYFSQFLPELPTSDEMFANSRYMRLDPVGFARDIHHGLGYITDVNQDHPTLPKMARTCSTCRQCWPSFVHFLLTPSAPKYLECPECTKRIPVGRDIHILPQRKMQSNTIALDGSPLDLNGIEGNGAGPVICTKQRCTSPSCPLKDHAHPIGLFSYPQSLEPAVPENAVALSAVPNGLIPGFDSDTNFWGGNDKIPQSIQEYAATIVREETIFRAGHTSAIERFRENYPRERMDSMREAVEAFRALHCGYEVLSLDKSLQLDQYPEHLRIGTPGSKLWVDTFIAGLSRVAVETLAQDDRECGICRGVYGEDICTGGEIESAVRLPCSHVLGEGCLAKLLLKKSCGGTGHSICPFCRTQVYEPAMEIPEEDYPTSLAIHMNYDMPQSEREAWYRELSEIIDEE